jgi:hypothetical protein
MYCTGPGPNGTVVAGQVDSCALSLTGGTLPAGSTVLLTPPSPPFTSVSCLPSGQGAAGCSFQVSNTITFHGSIGTETIHFAPDGPSQGGGAQVTQSAQACTPICHSVPLSINGPGARVGTPIPPRGLPGAPYVYKVCSGPNADGTVSETQVDVCSIYTAGVAGPFIAGDTLTVARLAPTDATVVSCGDGVIADASGRGPGSSTTSCSYRVGTSASGSGLLLGTERLSIPSTVVPGAMVAQVVTFCPAPQPTPQAPGCTQSPITVSGPGATVIDEIPPTFTSVPVDVTVDATGPTDTVVGYAPPTATDNAPGIVDISCSPASGALFAVGTTTVTCTATDVSGNSATAAFHVTVQNTFDSLCRVTGLEVSKEGIAHSLCKKLQNAADAVAAGDLNAADGILGAYINELDAQSGKALSDQQAQDLEGLARLLMP